MQTMTPGEQRVLETIARSRGWDFVNANVELILDQARAIEGDDLDSAD